MRFLFSLLLLLPSFGAWGAPAKLREEILKAATHYHLDPLLVEAMIEVESLFKPDAASSKGAVGLGQLMRRTAEEMGVANRYHILSNLMGTCEYLRTLLNRFRFDLTKAIAAYNAGPSKVEQYKGVPPFRETRKYVRKVLAAYKRLRETAR